MSDDVKPLTMDLLPTADDLRALYGKVDWEAKNADRSYDYSRRQLLDMALRLRATARAAVDAVTVDEEVAAYMLITRLRFENDGVMSARIARAALENFVATRSGRVADSPEKA